MQGEFEFLNDNKAIVGEIVTDGIQISTTGQLQGEIVICTPHAADVTVRFPIRDYARFAVRGSCVLYWQKALVSIGVETYPTEHNSIIQGPGGWLAAPSRRRGELHRRNRVLLLPSAEPHRDFDTCAANKQLPIRRSEL